MPYELDGNCVKKKDGETVKCHESHDDAVAHLQALQANVRHSGVVEMSMRISKASYNKSESEPMKWSAIDSDIDADLYDERMSVELYKDFVSRIESGSPIPEPFAEVICEADWCGGMPYLSIAHYKAGTGKINVPGNVESVFIDGTRLKSKGVLHDNDMGRKVFKALCDDLYKKEKSEADHLPVRISIGFLDLEHKHLPEPTGPEFVFTRTEPSQICPLCSQGVGGKIYMKGQLVHLALTRVPVNPRTEMLAEKSMDEIKTKRQDAESIIGELADGLEEKSIAQDVLVVRSDEEGTLPTPDPSELTTCYDPNTGGWDNACIASVMEKYMPDIRNSIGVSVKSMPKEVLDVVVAEIYKSNGYEPVEDAMKTTEVIQEAVAPVEKSAVEKDEKEAKESPEKEAKEEEKEEMKSVTALDKSFDALKALVAAGKSGKPDVEAINKSFAELGTAVENEFKPVEQKSVPGGVDMVALKSMLEEVVAPLRVEIATLKAQVGRGDTVSSKNGMVQSKALSLNYSGQRIEDIVQRSGQIQAPTRKLTQIEMLARRSTGASLPE